MLKIIQKFKDPLYKNSIFLMLTNIIGSILGFIYWTLAARYYSAQDVGIATALISAMNLIAAISRLGFDIGLIRFLPETERKSEMLSSVLILAFFISICISSFFIYCIDILAPELIFIQQYSCYLLVFIFTTSVTTILGVTWGAFIGFRKAEYSFIQNITWMGIKVPLVVLFTALGSFGIFLSWGISVAIALIFSLLVLIPRVLYNLKFKFEGKVIKSIMRFSFGNYIAGLFQMSPPLILPILILNVLGAKESAYFYVSWMIALLLFSVSTFSGFSMLAECSYKTNNIRREVFKALRFIFTLLIPAVFVVVIFGEWILHLFGKEYSENATLLLKVLAISSIPVALNTIYINIERIKNRVKSIIFIYGFIAFFTIGVSYLIMPVVGLIGVGIAWLSANIIVCLVLAIVAIKLINI